jgi:hypothetical protein
MTAGPSSAATEGTLIRRGEVQIEVLAQGAGRRVVLLPSLGRGASDFDAMAERIAGAGYRALRPQPRGIGASRSPQPYADLHDCAADIAAVIESDDGGAAWSQAMPSATGGAHARHRPAGPGARRLPDRRQCRSRTVDPTDPRGDPQQRQPHAA